MTRTNALLLTAHLPAQFPCSPMTLRRRRSGKILVLFALLLPALMGMLGLVLDGGLLMAEYRNAQHVADAAASAAAAALCQGNGEDVARADAERYVRQYNNLGNAEVEVNIPPLYPPFSADSAYVEVIIRQPVDTYFIQVLGSSSIQIVQATAVAGVEAATSGAAVVVLDPDPPPITLPQAFSAILSLPPLHLAGMEIAGLGEVKVDGAVLINTQWGGVDQDGDPAGRDRGPPYAASCLPGNPLSRLLARDIRVVGGVDDPDNYSHYEAGQSSPLEANKRAVPDPFRNLPVPTVSADRSNVLDIQRGGVEIARVPLVDPPIQLESGVYEWIDIKSGEVTFLPGVYILRNVSPVTGIALSITGGQIRGEGVMFYITDSTAYSPSSGWPDSQDGERQAAPPGATTLIPSVVLNTGLVDSHFSPLADTASPFRGMLIYQRRHDRRPIVIVRENLIPSSSFEGTVYSKWGQVILSGKGMYDARFVAGSIRILHVIDCLIAPHELLPPARDVFLVQ